MLRFIRKVHGNGQEALTTLTLPWAGRTRSRQRVRLDNGVLAGLFLERGVILRGGDLLQAEDGETIAIRAAPEQLSCIHCPDSLQLARLCYHLGNRHVELEITASRVRYPPDPVLDRMVIALGYEVRKEQAPFEPESGAFAGLSGHHHHDP